MFPSIKEQKIQKNANRNKAYELFNLNKNERTLEFTNIKSKQHKYLKKCLIRLARYSIKGEKGKFEFLMRKLLQKSHSLRVRAAYKVFRGFHT